MAHILIIYKQFPSPSVGHAGGESLFKLMQALHRRGHRLSLVARILDAERDSLPAVEAICERVFTVPHHRSLSQPRALAIWHSYRALRKATGAALRELQPDLVHIETTQTALILLGLRLPPTSFRTQDVNWFLQSQRAERLTGLSRLAAHFKSVLFRVFEPLLYRKFDLLLAISEGDRQLLAPFFKSRPLLLLPLTPTHVSVDAHDVALSPGFNLLFVGAMYRDHNISGVRWFLEDVWPRILEAEPQARFYVVGNGPPEWLQALADGQHLFVTGFVDDLTPWYQAATLFVSPMLVAGGLLQKVMDAMAMGTPVVATSVCNHGIGAEPGKHLLTANSAQEFAALTVDLLRNPAMRQRLAEAGQRFIRERYDSESAIDNWELAFTGLLAADSAVVTFPPDAA